MSILGKMIKRTVSSMATGTYDIISDVKGSIKETYERSQKEELKDDIKQYNELMSHLTESERKEVEKMAERISLVEMAKRQAKARNRFSYLENKYKEIDKKQIEGK